MKQEPGSPIPQTVVDWSKLTPEQDRDAIARLKSYIAESENARLIMRAGDRSFVQDEETVHRLLRALSLHLRDDCSVSAMFVKGNV